MKFKALCILPLLALAGCDNATQTSQAPTTQSETTPTETANTPSQPETSSEATPQDNSLPTVVVATTGKGVPFTYKDEKGQLVGIDVDIVRAIGEQEGFQIKVVEAQWKTMFDEVNEGKYDIVVSNISWTPERAGKYSLTDAYLFDPATVIYKADSSIKPKTISDLKPMKVGVLTGSSYINLLKEAEVTKLVEEKSGNEGLVNFMQGGTDAYVNSFIRLQYAQATHADVQLVVQPIESEDSKTASSVMVVNPAKSDLLAKLNTGIAKLKADGTIEKITQKHLFAPPTLPTK